MSRVIKFRAFDEQNLVMHNDFRFIKSGEEGNDWIVFTSDKQLLTDAPHPFDNPHFQQQLKVMQFTGLTDKNGVEIYEGDIVEYFSDFDESATNHQVKYFDKDLYPALDLSPSICDDMNGFSAIEYQGIGTIKVIGNIYQNPELLK